MSNKKIKKILWSVVFCGLFLMTVITGGLLKVSAMGDEDPIDCGEIGDCADFDDVPEPGGDETEREYSLSFMIKDKYGNPISGFENHEFQFSTTDGAVDYSEYSMFDVIGTHGYGFEYDASSDSINTIFRVADVPYICESDHDHDPDTPIQLVEDTVVTFTCHGTYYFNYMFLTPEGIKVWSWLGSSFLDPKPGEEDGVSALKLMLDAQNDGLLSELNGFSKRWDVEGDLLGVDWIRENYYDAFPDGVNYGEMSLLWGDDWAEPGKYIFYVFLADGLTVEELEGILGVNNSGLIEYLYNNVSDRIRVYGVIEQKKSPLRKVMKVPNTGMGGEPARFIELEDDESTSSGDDDGLSTNDASSELSGGESGPTQLTNNENNPNTGDTASGLDGLSTNDATSELSGGESGPMQLTNNENNPNTGDTASGLIKYGITTALISVLIARIFVARRRA